MTSVIPAPVCGAGIRFSPFSALSLFCNARILLFNSRKAGIQHYFTEHDEPKDPIASIPQSFQYLTALRF